MPPDLSSESSTYGHDPENEHVFFYHDNFEVDFYIPDAELAIQVSYSLREEDTLKGETEALQTTLTVCLAAVGSSLPTMKKKPSPISMAPSKSSLFGSGY